MDWENTWQNTWVICWDPEEACTCTAQCGCTSWSVQDLLEQKVWYPVSPDSQKSLPRPGTFSSTDNSRKAKTVLHTHERHIINCWYWSSQMAACVLLKLNKHQKTLTGTYPKCWEWVICIWSQFIPFFGGKGVKILHNIYTLWTTWRNLGPQIPPNKSYSKDKNFSRHLFSKEIVKKNNSESQRRTATLRKITVLLG